MDNLSVIQAFTQRKCGHTKMRNYVNGYYMCHGCTLESTGYSLINYATVIARWLSDTEVELDTRKYSSTTSRIQSKLRTELEKIGATIIEKQ